MKRLKAILMGAGLLAASHLQSGLAHADTDTNVNISADEMEVFDTEHQTVFRGNVMAAQSGQQIQADQMTVTNVDVKQDDRRNEIRHDATPRRDRELSKLAQAGQYVRAHLLRCFDCEV